MKYNLEEGEGVNCFRRVSQVSLMPFPCYL